MFFDKVSYFNSLDQGFLNYVAKQIGILCFVLQNFENPSSAAGFLEKIMVIAHAIGKSENLGTKIDELELDFKCRPFFREHLKLATKIDKSQFDSERIPFFLEIT